MSLTRWVTSHWSPGRHPAITMAGHAVTPGATTRAAVVATPAVPCASTVRRAASASAAATTAIALSVLAGPTSLASVATHHVHAVTNYAAMVNPFIGTTNGANTFPGADTPFG
ncbi:MAG TPA: hypothetical protein VGS19_02620, partial [Streptosporangiaceae bacterium]|nr:hypothetical protein [Streptosporangiaceae bacterium]